MTDRAKLRFQTKNILGLQGKKLKSKTQAEVGGVKLHKITETKPVALRKKCPGNSLAVGVFFGNHDNIAKPSKPLFQCGG